MRRLLLVVALVVGALPELAAAQKRPALSPKSFVFDAQVYGALPAATGATNVLAFNRAAAAAAAAGGGVVTAPPGSYNLSGTITAGSRVKFQLPGVTLTQTATNTPTIKGTGITDFVVEDGTFIGYGPTDANTTVNSAYWAQVPDNRAFAVWCDTCERVSIRRNRMSSHRGAGVVLWAPTDAWVENNRITGTFDGGVAELGLPTDGTRASFSQFGVLIQSASTGAVVGSRIHVARNSIDRVAHSVFIAPGFDYATVDANFLGTFVQQHGFYVYPTTNLRITGNSGHASTGSKVQAAPTNTQRVPTNVDVSGNTLSSDGAPALAVQFTDEYASSTPIRAASFIDQVTVVGNTLSSTAHAGLLLSGVRNALVTGNVIHDTARSGVYAWSTSGRISDNVLSRCGGASNDPIAVNASAYLTVQVVRNQIAESSSAATAYMSAVWDVTNSPPIAWSGSKYHAAGAYVQNGGNVYVATTGGVSAAAGGPSGVGTGIVDGAAVWNFVVAVASVDKGLIIFDGNAVAPSATEPTYSLYLSNTNVVLRGNRIPGTAKLINTATPASLEDDGRNVHGGWNAGAPYGASVLPGSARRDFRCGGSAPAAGTFQVGDRCWNTTPAAGGTLLWVCTTGGTPGTWKAVAIAP